MGARNVADACTVMRFSFGGHIVVARNHDWMFGEGLLVVNPRGLQKQAISPVQPAKWVSSYGSVSFVQFGREIPFAGMNEKGLTVDLLQLHQAEFPLVESGKHSVNVVQWVQYQLDTAASVSDVIDSLEKIYPTPMVPSIERVHYFVTDAAGDVATIEFLDGKANV
ncbi:Choloylglycine hydrolase, partial [Rhodopirellula maiorica SM1]